MPVTILNCNVFLWQMITDDVPNWLPSLELIEGFFFFTNHAVSSTDERQVK